MIKLQALTDYLRSRDLVPPEQLDSWAETSSVELIWKDSVDGMYMGDFNYSAVISFERFSDHPARLVALVGSWLETNDQDRDGLPQVKLDIEMLDNDLADVDIAIAFSEPQYLTEDPDGEIMAFGKTYTFKPFELWIAEKGGVVSGQS